MESTTINEPSSPVFFIPTEDRKAEPHKQQLLLDPSVSALGQKRNLELMEDGDYDVLQQLFSSEPKVYSNKRRRLNQQQSSSIETPIDLVDSSERFPSSAIPAFDVDIPATIVAANSSVDRRVKINNINKAQNCSSDRRLFNLKPIVLLVRIDDGPIQATATSSSSTDFSTYRKTARKRLSEDSSNDDISTCILSIPAAKRMCKSLHQSTDRQEKKESQSVDDIVKILSPDEDKINYDSSSDDNISGSNFSSQSSSSDDDDDDDYFPQNCRSKSVKKKRTKRKLKSSISPATSSKGKDITKDIAIITKKPKAVPKNYESTPDFIENGEMTANQLSDLNWLIALHTNGENGILNDQTGRKNNITLSIIAFFAHLIRALNVNNGPHLLVASSTLEINNWIDAFQKWAPYLRVIPFASVSNETKKQKTRNTRLLKNQEWDICITSSHTLTSQRGMLTSNTFKWDYVVIDDAEMIKNKKTLISQTVRKLKYRNRILITGKPMNTFDFPQFWELLNFVDPIQFDNYNRYVGHESELLIAMTKPFIRCRQLADGQLLKKINEEDTVQAAATSDDWFDDLLSDFMPSAQPSNINLMASNDYDAGASTSTGPSRVLAVPPSPPSNSAQRLLNMPMIDDDFFSDVVNRTGEDTTDVVPTLRDMPLLW